MSNISIEERLTEYLQNDSDYAFELRCLNAISTMSQCSTSVSHAGTYEDDITGKLRQYDLRARIWPHADLPHTIHTAVECKHLSPEVPLILHCSRRNADSAFIQYIENERRDLSVDQSLRGPPYVIKESSGTHCLYSAEELTAKSIERVTWNSQQIPKSNDSEIYDRWSQALGSMAELVSEARTDWPQHLPDNAEKSIHYFLPVVAVPDSSLWVVGYDANGTYRQDLSQVDEMSFFVDRKYLLDEHTSFRCSHVHFVTESHLQDFFWRKLNEFVQ